jgi:hypothetical protein
MSAEKWCFATGKLFERKKVQKVSQMAQCSDENIFLLCLLRFILFESRGGLHKS